MEAKTTNITLSKSRCGVKPRHKIVKLYITARDWLICSPGSVLSTARAATPALLLHYHEVNVARNLHTDT